MIPCQRVDRTGFVYFLFVPSIVCYLSLSLISKIFNSLLRNIYLIIVNNHTLLVVTVELVVCIVVMLFNLVLDVLNHRKDFLSYGAFAVDIGLLQGDFRQLRVVRIDTGLSG